jgi:hypothetical protein
MLKIIRKILGVERSLYDDFPKICPKCNGAFKKEDTECFRCKQTLILLPKIKNKGDIVSYGDKQGKQYCIPYIDQKTGERKMEVYGERYPIRGVPRHHILNGPLGVLKRFAKNFIIEQIANELAKGDSDEIPIENCTIPIRELARVFDLWEKAEDEPEMKKLVRQIKKVVCRVGEEDDAWRFRAQWFYERIDKNKFKLDDSDKYYFKGKSFNQEMI